jgi:gamma-glutamylaminecyclotransferase
MFAVLDKLEDYPSWYDREIQDMNVANGEKIPCWVYILRNFPEKLLQLPFLTSYEDMKDSPYLERSKRSEIKARDDLEFGI